MYVRISDAVLQSICAACIDRYEPADNCTYVWHRIACVRNMLNSARVSLGFVRLLDDAQATHTIIHNSELSCVSADQVSDISHNGSNSSSPDTF